jgi:hypothetical protein
MTDFNELELNKSVDSLEADEAKKTLSEFMEQHQKNQAAYDELNDEIDELETEYKQEIAKLEKRVTEFKEERAEEAAEYVNMPADLLVDRFSIEELDQIIEEGADADFSEDEPEDEDEPENLTTFSERPEKGRKESGSKNNEAVERARNRLRDHGFPTE